MSVEKGRSAIHLLPLGISLIENVSKCRLLVFKYTKLTVHTLANYMFMLLSITARSHRELRAFSAYFGRIQSRTNGLVYSFINFDGVVH